MDREEMAYGIHTRINSQQVMMGIFKFVSGMLQGESSSHE